MRRLCAALVVALLAGCGAGDDSGPPAILYGVDICDHCSMVISEERHAAGARFAEGERRFDDPGCMLDLLDARGGEAPIGAWVHDERLTWLPVEEAWFVDDPDRGTPMGSGILAFGTREAAAAAAERYGGEPRRWAERAAPPGD